MNATTLPQDASEADLVLPKTHRVDELPSYCVPDTDLEMGASLGNSSCWITTKGTGDIESVFSTYLGQKVLGALCIRYRVVGRLLLLPFQESARRFAADCTPTRERLIQVYRQTPGQFELHPAFQRHSYELPGDLWVEETIFVPSVTPPCRRRNTRRWNHRSVIRWSGCRAARCTPCASRWMAMPSCKVQRPLM